MLIAIPLTIVPLIVYNILAFGLGGSPWSDVLFSIPLISGAVWPITIADLMILLGLVALFFEMLRSAQVSTGATIANHIVSTILLVVYIVEFIVVRLAGVSLFFLLTAMALFDVVAGFTISIKTAQRDISLDSAARSH
jgi:hypothetical protein